jgi:hypothetical protein
MEDELWDALYQLLLRESNRRSRRKGVWFSDIVILAVFFWAVLHDRPISWACRPRNWPPEMRWRLLPSRATMSRRMRTFSVLNLLEAMLSALGEAACPTLVRSVDAKPLVVGGFSKDADAKWGYAVHAKAKGYKLFSIWSDRSPVPEQWCVGPMNRSEPIVAQVMIGRLDGGGYVLGDSSYDTNALHQLCEGQGLQLLAPRKNPGTQLGHKVHAPSRLRSIELLETRPAMRWCGSDCGQTFGPSVFAGRTGIERHFGQMGNFGGGLSPLPNWVRRPHRVVPWIGAKILLNGLRICRNKGLAA